jgi:crotonobetainyl-CoA:carnitine CoA-transferase CaiB-like acyl-CoA transferase
MKEVKLPAGKLQSFMMLDNIVVADLTTSIAGPYASMLLGDFGAQVIKIERLEGDDARQWGPPFLDGESLWFLSVNRNKRSIRIDYGSNEGRKVLKDLLDKSDVLITNQLPEVQKKLGIDATAVRAHRPRLLHVSLTGFGLSGLSASRPCYDLIAEGYSGIMDLTGTADGGPQKIGAPAADMLGGSDAVMAVLAALNRRASTQQGCAIDISLTESMVRFLSPRIVPYLGGGEIPRRSGGTDSVIAIYQTFDTADLPITLALGNDAIWHRFWKAVGQDPPYDAGDLSTNRSRREHRERIVACIEEVLKQNTRSVWLELFGQAKVPAGPIYRVDEVVQDAHFRDRSLFFHIERDGHEIPQVSLGIHVDGSPCGYCSAPPKLGEHTDEILQSVLNYDQPRIDLLRRQRVI